MAVDFGEQLRKVCVGLDVYRARNRIMSLFSVAERDIDIEFEESESGRFVVVDCSHDEKSGTVRLTATSANPIRHLPSMYQENDFLRRFLMPFQHIMNQTAITLDNVDNLFRPMETPSKFLPVLANWFGVDYELLGDEDTARKVLQYTIPLYRYRGTKRGLRALLYLVGGVMPEILEGRLPFEAMSITGGTEVNATIVDIEADEIVFSVYYPMYVEDMDGELVKRIYRIIQNEKPVHTQGYLYFKMPEAAARETLVISDDIQAMDEEGARI